MINLGELRKFLVKAKKDTYAGDGEEVTPQRPGFRELEFEEGDWNYRDSYVGFFMAPGQEVVRYQGEPVWTMAYSGGMKPVLRDNFDFSKETFEFLKRALLHIPENAPYRGPLGEWSDRKGWLYENDIVDVNDITDFRGFESIWFTPDGESPEIGQEAVFHQTYMGGLVLPK